MLALWGRPASSCTAPERPGPDTHPPVRSGPPADMVQTPSSPPARTGGREKKAEFQAVLPQAPRLLRAQADVQSRTQSGCEDRPQTRGLPDLPADLEAQLSI